VGVENLTHAGVIIGTPGYMAPEQLRGETVAEQADLFATGAVLYEMISGRMAFPGATADERFAAILLRDPDPIEGVDAADELSAILRRGLARKAMDRYPSARDFLREIRLFGGLKVATPQSVTLAALDFASLSPGEASEWMASALPESFASAMARIPGVNVLPREKVMAAAAEVAATAEEDVPSKLDIGQRLGCNTVLSGTFQPGESELSVTVKVTEVATGFGLHEETYRGSPEQILDKSDHLAAALAAALDLDAPRSTARVPMTEAYECHARGRRLIFSNERGAFDQARILLERAVELDPEYAQALAGLTILHGLAYNWTNDPSHMETARAYASRAIEADPLLAEAYLWRAYANEYQASPPVIRDYRKALELDPSSYLAAYFNGTLLGIGRPRGEALEVVALLEGPSDCDDPHEWLRHEAVRLLQRSVELNPLFCYAWLALGVNHLELGRVAEARWCLGHAVELEPRSVPPSTGVVGYLAECLRRGGELAEARRRFIEAIESIERSDHMYRDTWRGLFQCGLGKTAIVQGDKDAARVAYTQAVLHLRGRPRARCGGHILIQALAGLSRAGDGAEPLDQALDLLHRREGYDFGPTWIAADDSDLLEIARAADVLGRTALAGEMLSRARETGSSEAKTESFGS
jgi:tetratricopeptide (TPR) repeat protein